MNDDLAAVEKSLHYWEEQAEMAEQAFERARAQLAAAQKKVEIARNYYEMERDRLHPEARASSRFSGMTLREACLTIVGQSGRATIREIVDQLRAGGYELKTKFPGRAIHAALIRAPGVRKAGPGVYEAASSASRR